MKERNAVPARQPLWIRLLGALGVIVVGFPAAAIVSLTIQQFGRSSVGDLAFLASGVIGLLSAVLLYRVSRGDILGRNALIAMATGVVVTFIGSAKAYVAVQRSFEGVYVTHMMSELRTLATDQEAYLTKHGTFATDTALLSRTKRYPSSIAITLEHADSASWRASATYRPATKRTCRIAGTRAAPIADAVCD